TSGCQIATPTGSMKGAYFFVAEDGERFDVPIDEFALAMPRTLH
ncbi:MAG: Co2+/Mg2+ efflux protein ApaG, partial [Quisquiliibacterium sp.]